MSDLQNPYHKLHLFMEKIDIHDSEIERLEPYKQLFIDRKDAFADYFHDVFYNMPDSRAILDSEREPGLMKRVWSNWFASFFRSKLDDDFLAYLWKIGARHVEVNLDQRFSNLGFAVIRQFCHRVIMAEVPLDRRGSILTTIDKLVDLCLLVETDAYIENSISCDIEVMREVADRVRNPAMIIGASIKRLQNKADADTREYRVYEMLMNENRRLENMVHDIKVYMDMFEGEPEFQPIELEGLIAPVLGDLQGESRFAGLRVDVDLDDKARYVKGDPQWLKHLFYYLIQNSMEAGCTAEDSPCVRLISRLESATPPSIRIEIFNSGRPPEGDMEKLFSPFFSTKTGGTGFGLPIARLVVRKHHGTLSIEPADGQGTAVVINLPVP
jgi:signal transduction histidine kinase